MAHDAPLRAHAHARGIGDGPWQIGLGECLDREWEVTDSYFGGSNGVPSDRRCRIDRAYARVSRDKMQATLKARLAKAGVDKIKGRADPSTVRLACAPVLLACVVTLLCASGERSVAVPCARRAGSWWLSTEDKEQRSTARGALLTTGTRGPRANLSPGSSSIP